MLREEEGGNQTTVVNSYRDVVTILFQGEAKKRVSESKLKRYEEGPHPKKRKRGKRAYTSKFFPLHLSSMLLAGSSSPPLFVFAQKPNLPLCFFLKRKGKKSAPRALSARAE